MNDDLALRRQYFAEEIEAVANLRTPGLVEALARVPREHFLGPGPWVVRSESDIGAPPRQTPDANPRRVYHNLSIAIDAGRQLFNGQPGLVTLLLDAVGLRPGARVLHVGCGAGYYAALMAQIVGPAGSVVAIEVDEALAATAADNLREWSWVDVRHGNGTQFGDAPFDAVVVNAGVTHPLDAWLDGLSAGGRMVLPLTVAMGAASPIGKGVVVLLSKGEGDNIAARVLTFVAIYSALDLRDDSLNAALGESLKRMPFPRLSRLRRDRHEAEPSCWLHTDRFCLA